MPDTPCFHCGLAIPRGARFTALIAGEPRAMCCAGCAAVAELIDGSGLGAYYRHREAPSGERVATGIEDARFAVFDEPDTQRDFVRREDDGQCQARVAVDGMHCAACAWLIERHLGRLPGVESVNVNLAESRATVRWRDGAQRLSRLMAAMAQLGYHPRPFLPSRHLAAAARENRGALLRLGVAGIVQMQIGMIAFSLYTGVFEDTQLAYRDYLRWASLILCTPVVLYSAAPFFAGAWRGVRRGLPGMDLPVALAIALAYSVSAWFTVRGGGEVYFESVSMFTFLLLLGRYLEMRSRHASALASMGALAAVPDCATRIGADGGTETVPLARLRRDDIVLVRPGETLPADGLVVEGESHVDESNLTGESFPVTKGVGAYVSAATRNVDGALRVRVDAVGLDSRIGTILALADRAQEEKPREVELADRAASAFTVVVLSLAALAWVWWRRHDADRALEIVLSVLVVSCPCALSLATPAALTIAHTTLKRAGFLVTRGHALGTLARAGTVVFDKTGTLTSGRIRVLRTVTASTLDEHDCRARAARLEALSEHPIAAAFRDDAGTVPATAFRLVPGCGIEGEIDGVRHRIGQPGWIAPDHAMPSAGKWVVLARENTVLAWFELADSPHPQAGEALAALRELGLDIRLLSGDAAPETGRIARLLSIAHWQGECTAEGKLEALRALDATRPVVMVGDGINDIPVLAGASVSVAMATAADLTRASADCLLLGSDLRRIPQAIGLARRARRIVRENLCWALLYNLVALPFAMAGVVSPWLAALGMSGSSLLVVLNASRLRAPTRTPVLPLA